MVKKFILIFLILTVGTFLAFAFKKSNQVNLIHKCKGVIVEITNTEISKFVDSDITRMQIIKSEFNPIGKTLSEINTFELEQDILKKNDYINSVNVFITNQDQLKVKIEQKRPIIRIIPNNKSGYYLDQNFKKLSLVKDHAAYILTASGTITNEEMENKLCQLAQYIENDNFWNAQISQIYVCEEQEIHLITRVGNHKVTIGDISDIDKKLNRLMTFYIEGLNKYGWNKYSNINLKFKDQVICSK